MLADLSELGFSDREDEEDEEEMRRRSGDIITELIVQELQKRHFENASDALKNKLLPDLIKRVADEAGEKQISEVYLHFRPNRANSKDPLIDWHIDINYDGLENNVNGIIDMLVTDRAATTERSRNTERLLEMHGLGGDCKNLDGGVTFNAFQNNGPREKRSLAAEKTEWDLIEFWTATFNGIQVSILKGIIHYTEFMPGGGNEYSTERITRFSICPLT